MFDFSLVVPDNAFGTSVATTLDMLRSANALARRVRAPDIRWRVISPSGGLLKLQSGLLVETAAMPSARAADRSTWIIPGLGVNTEAEIHARLLQPDLVLLLPRLTAHVQSGGAVATGCSSVFVLAAAGLLGGRRATTTWWLAPALKRMAPTCRIDASQMVCVDGPVTTAGAAFAHTDLMLHLLRSRSGPRLAEEVSRFLIIDTRESQSPYVVPEVFAAGDELISHLISRIEKAFPGTPKVSDLASEFCVSERTLSRRVHRATGRGTLALIQTVRLRRARHLLEHSRLSVEQVATAVGYEDPTALRRLIRRATGTSPRQHRSMTTHQL